MTAADLLAWQERLGISGAEAARRLGIPYPSYRNYLTIRRRMPGWLPLLCRYVERYGPLDRAA